MFDHISLVGICKQFSKP
uniref:Uncharacterized protein n=1 Tax=Rhizophora mucronata TaxID=61149 RepID=A0A2P2NUM3_RHIMU